MDALLNQLKQQLNKHKDVMRRHGMTTLIHHRARGAIQSTHEAIKLIENFNQWQPIDTAPRDGTEFLIYYPPIIKDVQLAKWDSERQLFNIFSCQRLVFLHDKDTIWQLKPQPPKEKS